MVKKQKNNTRKNRSSKGFKANRGKAGKINVSTADDTYTEQVSPFGGFLASIKFLGQGELPNDCFGMGVGLFMLRFTPFDKALKSLSWG